MFYLAGTVQNILVLIVEAKDAGAVLPQRFEDVKMAVSRSKMERSAFLNTILVINDFDQVRLRLVICCIHASGRLFA